MKRPQQNRLATDLVPLARTLGQREREVMSILCTQESASVQQVSERLSSNLAYTTVMTTLDRLFRKGFLERRKQDRAYIYSAAVTSREIEGQRAAE
jgi:BlaI family penicillinase repressor